MRKLSEISGGSPKWKEFRYPAQMAEFQRLATEVSVKTYQHRDLRVGLEDSPSYWEEIVRFAAEDRVRGHILFDRETPIAFSLCRGFGDDLFAEIIGFDPSYAEAYGSPGIVLYCLMLQKLFADDRFRHFVLGAGDFPYKAHYATGHIDAADIYYFTPDIRNVIFVIAKLMLNAIDYVLRSAVKSLKISPALKKAIRRRIGRRSRN
jgi:CelD/BcsL family acetyltransferase involved in cellulose biosynthesis